jgi:3-oxoisoapionate decarboxylase
MITRREFLLSLGPVGAAAWKSAFGAIAGGVPRTTMGIVQYSFSSSPHLESPLDFLEYCASLGAGGVQMELGSLSDSDTDELRRRAQELEMTLEVIVALPKQGDASAFERAVEQAKRAGAVCLRSACLNGRRYETFESLDDWDLFVVDSMNRVHQALPVLEKYKLPLGIENHKDWTADELKVLVREISSEYLGVCLDTGNNLSLLDEPNDLVRTLAPFAVTTHFKDMAVEESSDGFLLSEVPLGEGILDLPAIVKTLREAGPKARFNLEMITRDPLMIPCLTDRYWATFPDRNGRYLARTLDLVRGHKPRSPLPRVSGLGPSARAALEESNVKTCLRYARQKLGLV